MGMFERSREAEGDFFHGAANEFFAALGMSQGKSSSWRECGGATGRRASGRGGRSAGGESVDDFIEGASPPQAMTRPRPSKAARWAISVAWPGPVVSASSDSMPPAAKYGEPHRACRGGLCLPRRHWVVNQQSVSKICSHRWFRVAPFVL